MEIQHNFSYQAFSCFRVDLTGDVSDDFFFFLENGLSRIQTCGMDVLGKG